GLATGLRHSSPSNRGARSRALAWQRTPPSARSDIGRVRMFHADDMIAGVDVMNLSRHAAGQVGEQIDSGIADLVGRHVAPQWRIELRPLEDVAKIADARCCERLYRTGRK